MGAGHWVGMLGQESLLLKSQALEDAGKIINCCECVVLVLRAPQ